MQVSIEHIDDPSLKGLAKQLRQNEKEHTGFIELFMTQSDLNELVGDSIDEMEKMQTLQGIFNLIIAICFAVILAVVVWT